MISVTIMAHPKRRAQANALLAQLDLYPFKQCSVVWDRLNDEWNTGKRSLEAGIDAASDWHVVLQDDAILPPNFYDHIVGALNAVPIKSLISLYTGTTRPLPKRVTAAIAKARQASWLRSDMLLWGVGIVIPTAHITEVLDFVSDRQEVYDFRIGWAYQRNRLPIFYTNPSLVDHNNDLGSLLKESPNIRREDYEKEPRRARNFIGNKKAAWNDRVIDI